MAGVVRHPGGIWGCSFWWIKLGLRAGSPVDVAFARLATGAVALLLVATLTRSRLPRQAATWGHLFVLAGIINALTPLTTLLAALTIFREQRPNSKIIGGLAIGFAGVLVVVGVWHGLGRGQLLVEYPRALTVIAETHHAETEAGYPQAGRTQIDVLYWHLASHRHG